MKNFAKIVLILILVLSAKKSFADFAWNNDLRTLFLNKDAVIYVLNIRTFNASDKNQNGVIDFGTEEETGNFVNAAQRLDELKVLGVNTVHLLPITPVGKVKALGTAGSLHAISSFSELNPQLKSSDKSMTLEQEVKFFINECHRRKIRVIVDLPACAAYDLYLNHPDLFVKDKSQNPVIPADWTDVRLLDAGSEDKINQDVYGLYQSFMDLMLDLHVDGVRADVASIKPFAFWKKLINETHARDSQFLFLADATSNSDKVLSNFSTVTSLQKLLDAGFDGYSGGYYKISEWKSASEFYAAIKKDLAVRNRNGDAKQVIGDFATHDQISPILANGPQLSRMIIWLNATLPLVPYYVDGFSTGDTYLFPLMNKKAAQTFTDDEYYFVHRGQLDIFNFTRKPQGKHVDLFKEMVLAERFRLMTSKVVNNGTFVPLYSSNSSVFSYARNYEKMSILVIGNLDFKRTQEVSVRVPKLTKDVYSFPVKITTAPEVSKGKITSKLQPGEIQVLLFKDFNIN